MKALSVRQPWAWCLFHASKTWDREGDLWIRKTFRGLLPTYCVSKSYVLGVIVGRVDLVKVVRSHPSPWFFGPYGFVFENQIEFKDPIPWAGSRLLFDVPDHILPGAEQR